MEKVIAKLKDFNTEINLKDRFKYDFKVTNGIFTEEDIKKIKHHENLFEKNIALKWLLEEKYKLTSNKSLIDFWIINEWGGIRGFKNTKKNLEKITKFRKQLKVKKLTFDSFSTISSLSKVASFMNPEEFVIYDSRVIYSLNWLILTCENQNGLKRPYFPIPTGRNKIIADFDMNTVINISHLQDYLNNKESLFVNKKLAYFYYCTFCREASEIIFGKDAKPYQIEMLLFTIADEKIFSELQKSLSIQIKPINI